MPDSLVKGRRIKVTSVLITQGINEAQTMANAIGSATLQDTLNNVGLGTIERYSRRLKRFHNKMVRMFCFARLID